ncbi:MAG: carboxypeptidase regulatory-like domain-containing protein [Desulfuromonadales bacterium]|nr:carboxypeptidase regulatory-like domain-containing protein [Desulfuromonadales bacterium]
MKYLLCTVLLCVLSSGTALAHKVNIFAWVAAGTVYCETYFPDGRPVKDGQIIVLDAEDNELLTGRTDDEGLFNFKITTRSDLTIIIDASMGHRNSIILKKGDLQP